MKNRIYRFMQGRYNKFDSLNKLLFKVYILIAIINIFVKSIILSTINITLGFYIFFRLLSRNVKKRTRENEIFLSYIIRKRENKDNIYKRCHYCHKLLKLPLPPSRGIKRVICPKCKKKNKFLILRKQKIEIISPRRTKNARNKENN